MRSSALAEIGSAWLAHLGAHWPLVVLGLAVGGGLGALIATRRTPRLLAHALWIGSAAVGARLAWGQASVVDDAFISFRYARHLLAGHGLVYNEGEAVEGFTNLLWTLLVALGSAITGAELPLVALVLGGLVFVANVAVAAAIGRALAGDGPHLPLAAALLGVQYAVTAFATTGLETGAAMLCVQLGLLGLATGRPALAGTGFVLATLMRPDQFLFFAAGAGVLGWGRADRRAWVAYLAPLGLLAASEVWRVLTYGALLPNTFYAKAGGAYWSQGLVYAAEFHLGSHFWLVLLLCAGALALPARGPAERDLRRFAALALPVFELYVARLGGDFMAGRFYVSLVPVGLLVAEGVVHGAAARSLGAGVASAALLFATVRGTSLVGDNRIRWFMADENTVYPLVSLSPVTIRHSFWRAGHFLHDRLTARGLTPVLASGNIGFLGYYSELPLIDLHGLTDATIARMPVASRGHPGHEKFGRREYYVDERGAELALSPAACSSPHPDLSTLKIRGWPTSRPLCLLVYGPERVAQLREVGLVAPPIDGWLDDYVASLDGRAPDDVERSLRWLDDFYFDEHPDPAHRDAIGSWLRAARRP